MANKLLHTIAFLFLKTLQLSVQKINSILITDALYYATEKETICSCTAIREKAFFDVERISNSAFLAFFDSSPYRWARTRYYKDSSSNKS
jgi:hypothetical protein